jgi:hypothetical protein
MHREDMGGNAFPDTRRLGRAERDRIVRAVTGSLCTIGRCVAPLELADKETFGDVDFVVCGPRDAVREAMTVTLGCTIPFVACGPHDSFLTPERYQVDVTYCPLHLFDMHVAFTSHGDLCMIAGLSLGGRVVLTPHGLWTRSPKVVLSTEPDAVARFLGLPDLWTPMTKDQMFSSILHGATFFEAGAIASVTRKNTIKRRPAFVEFQAMCTGVESRSPGDVVQLALDHFGKRSEYEAAVAAAEQAARDADLTRRCKEILNGRDVLEWLPGLDGPGVGRVLREVRGDRTLDEYLGYLTRATRDELKLAVALYAPTV